MSVRARGVQMGEERFTVALEDGRRISVPLSWFPRLAEASRSERRQWHLIGDGEGVCWPELDVDVSVESLLKPRSETRLADPSSRS